MHTLEIIESHTGGEPTRVIIAGGPDFSFGSMEEKLSFFKEHHDWLRRVVCNEPRGHDAMVGALITPAAYKESVCGVIFFNNVGTLHMCIHGTIGLIITLKSMGLIDVGAHKIDTAVGTITATLHEDGLVEVVNVPSYRIAKNVKIVVPEFGEIHGDIAWGGNWFFLVDGQGPEVTYTNRSALAEFSKHIRAALTKQKITAPDGHEIDHVEIFGPPNDPFVADSRNFVYCPGHAYDRSPCGTGTSAKLACLYADGKMQPGEIWRQAGILDTVFSGSFELLDDGNILPRVSGRAWLTGKVTYYFNPTDPFRYGIA